MNGHTAGRIVAGRARRYSGGFSLLEVLVAFTIFVVVAGTVMQAFGTSLRGMRVASEHAHALALAEAKLAELSARARLEEGVESGRFDDDGHRWRTEIGHFRWDGEQAGSGLPVRPYRVAVEVSWEGDTGRRSVRLQSLRLVATP